MEKGEGKKPSEVEKTPGGSEEVPSQKVPSKVEMTNPKEKDRGYKELAAAILERAVDDWKHFLFLENKHKQEIPYFVQKGGRKILKNDLEQWFDLSGRHAEESFTFSISCDMLGVDPDAFRARVKRLKGGI